MTPTFYGQDFLFQIPTEDALLELFREKDRRRVIPPRGMEYPLRTQYYFTWSESSGVYRYLVFKKPGWEMPKGLVFKRSYSSAQQGMGALCDWCHAYGSSDQIGLLTTAIDSKHTVGMMLCLDLSCGDKIESMPSMTNKSPETLLVQLCEKIGRFFEDSVSRI